MLDLGSGHGMLPLINANLIPISVTLIDSISFSYTTCQVSGVAREATKNEHERLKIAQQQAPFDNKLQP
jgi:hypothetical protein